MKNKKAFTLIEIVSSLVIVGVALVAILNMYSFTVKTGVINEARVTAMTLLERKLEALRCEAFWVDLETEDASFAGYSDYTFTITENANYEGNSGMKHIEVMISWTTPFGGAQSETIQTIISDHR